MSVILEHFEHENASLVSSFVDLLHGKSVTKERDPAQADNYKGILQRQTAGRLGEDCAQRGDQERQATQ